MEITSTRKLLSYFVTFMLLYFCKYSYDYHKHQDQLQAILKYQELQNKGFSLVVDSENYFAPTVLPPSMSAAHTPMIAVAKSEVSESMPGLRAVAKAHKELKLAKPVLAKMQYSEDAEVHAVGVYEAEKTENTPAHREGNRYGKVKINVTASAHPIILVLMSYEPVLWELGVSKDAVIEQIILGGYYGQEVTGVDKSIPLMVYTGYPSPCSNCFRGNGGFYSYESASNNVTNKIFEITGKKVTTFQGSYKGSIFNIMDNMPRLEY